MALGVLSGLESSSPSPTAAIPVLSLGCISTR